MSSILNFFKNLGSKIYKMIDKMIVTPISKLIYILTKKLKQFNKLESILNRPTVLLYLSLIMAILIFFLVDSKVIAFSNTAEIITGQPITVKYNSNAYVVEGIPDTVDITLMGRKSDLYLAKQLGDHEIILDLNVYEPSDEPQKVKLTYNQTIDSISYKLDPSYVTVTIKKKERELKNITYDLMNSEKLDSKLSVKSVELSKTEAVVKASRDTLDKISSIKALIDLSDSRYTEKGVYNVENVSLAAYDDNGLKLSNVEIVATNVTATMELDSYSKNVPISIKTDGELVAGKAISSITINGKSDYNVTIYGEQAAVDSITSIPVTVYVDGQGNNGSQTYSVDISKPSGIRSISETTATVVLNYGEAKQKTIDGIQVDQKNIPSGLVATAKTQDDSSVSVQVIGVESVIDDISASDIKAYIDLADYSEGDYTVEVEIENSDPRVSYIVTKKINIELNKK